MTQRAVIRTDSAPSSASGRGQRIDRLDLDLLPGPRSSRWLGQFGNIFGYVRDPVGYTDKLAHGGYGNIAIFARGMRRGLVAPARTCPAAVFVMGRELVQKALMKHDSPYPGSLPADCGEAARLTEGVTWLQGTQHRRHRRVMNPIYHQRRVHEYRDAFVSVVNENFGDFTPGKRVGIVRATGATLLEFQNKVVLGVADMPGEMRNIAQQMLAFFDRMIEPLAYLGADLPFTPRRRMLRYGEHLTKQLKTLIAHKRGLAEPADDVLSMLANSRCEDGELLTPDELVAEMFMAFIGGWISTRSALASALFLIAQHPSVAAELHDELHTKLQGQPPTFEQLAELPMLDRVVKETLRLLPPIPYVPRTVSEAGELGGFRLPVGTELVVSFYHTHREADLYPEPQRFRPERWLTLKPATHAYLPFGFGPRICVGMALANMQLRIMIALLVQRYRFAVPRGSTINYGGMGVIVPKPDMSLLVCEQDRRFDQSPARVGGNINRMVELQHE